MPLRDHFQPPVSKQSSWEGFHGFWPCAIVAELLKHLPANYTAEPRIHLGRVESGTEDTATALQPMLESKTSGPNQYKYEVLVFDQDRDRCLVAAIEIACPANKDRPKNRRAFVGKCAGLLRKGVSLAIVDLVTAQHFNLYSELLELLGESDPEMAPPPPTYAVALQPITREGRSVLQVWSCPVEVGQPLPTLPLWLADGLPVPIDLEASYEESCRVLRIS